MAQPTPFRPRVEEHGTQHAHESILQNAVPREVRKAGLCKRDTCHTFGHSLATHPLEAGHEIPTVREVLGHSDVKIRMIYTHVGDRGPAVVRSPVATLSGHDEGFYADPYKTPR